MRVVLDTNVLVSGTFWKGASSDIIKMICNKKLDCVLSRDLIEEYNNVVNRDEIMEKIENKDLVINNSVQEVISLAYIVEPVIKLNVLKEDSDDNMVLECASEGMADYVISYDKHLLKLKEFERIKIVTPEEFLNSVGLF